MPRKLKAELQAELTDANSTIVELKTSLKGVLKEHKVEMSQLKNELHLKTEIVADVKTVLKGVRSELITNKDDVTNLKGKIKLLKLDVTAANDVITNLKEVKQDLLNELKVTKENCKYIRKLNSKQGKLVDLHITTNESIKYKITKLRWFNVFKVIKIISKLQKELEIAIAKL